METENFIPIDKQLKDFKKHLDNNNRCVFSARFGDGKSYFLSEFMEEYKDRYLFIPIYPINYQVTDNKDIFEYIKRDILIKLFATEEVYINDEEIGRFLLLSSYIMNNPGDLTKSLIKVLPDINLMGVKFSPDKVLVELNKLKTKFGECSENFKTEEEKIKNYLKKFEGQQGSIYEFDPISQLICDINDRYRADNKEKEIVLIIEDLDRIDPAHIFRILNIFSAHFDRYGIGAKESEETKGNNKFKFDKIVTVCHFENIKNIYKHLYGEATDFNGYIGKFTTSIPFEYSLKDGFKNFILDHIDGDLKQYPLVCDTLASTIMLKYTVSENIESNLRKIKTTVTSKPHIHDKEILILGNLKIKTVNNLTKLVDLLRRSNITWEDFMKYNQKENRQKELHALVGAAYLLINEVTNTIQFQKFTSPEDIELYDNDTKYHKPVQYISDQDNSLITDLKLDSLKEDKDEPEYKMYTTFLSHIQKYCKERYLY